MTHRERRAQRQAAAGTHGGARVGAGRPRVHALPTPAELTRREELKRKRAADAAWRRANPTLAAKNYQLRHQYGIGVDEWQAMFSAQDGACSVCRRAFGGYGDDRACVDHNHLTGKVRGLLCNRCNAALGDLGDDEQRFAAVARYLGFRLEPIEADSGIQPPVLRPRKSIRVTLPPTWLPAVRACIENDPEARTLAEIGVVLARSVSRDEPFSKTAIGAYLSGSATSDVITLALSERYNLKLPPMVLRPRR